VDEVIIGEVAVVDGLKDTIELGGETCEMLTGCGSSGGGGSGSGGGSSSSSRRRRRRIRRRRMRST